MLNAKNGKEYAISTAICFVFIAVYKVIQSIDLYSNPYYFYDWRDYLDLAIYIGLAVTLFLKNKYLVTIVFGINALFSVTFFDVHGGSIYNFVYLLDLLTHIAVVVILVLSIKNNQITKKIWFIGGALVLVRTLIIFCFQRHYISPVLYFEMEAFLFVGLWAKESIISKETAPEKESATFNPRTYSSAVSFNNAIEGTDALKIYKELLDSGTIAQEEFETKKKQILGL